MVDGSRARPGEHLSSRRQTRAAPSACRTAKQVRRDRHRRGSKWAFRGLCLGSLLLLALPVLALFVPGRIGDNLFLLGLLAWWLPARTLTWTGLFRYHEFGGGPTGPLGLLVTLASYVGLSWLVSNVPALGWRLLARLVCSPENGSPEPAPGPSDPGENEVADSRTRENGERAIR